MHSNACWQAVLINPSNLHLSLKGVTLGRQMLRKKTTRVLSHAWRGIPTPAALGVQGWQARRKTSLAYNQGTFRITLSG